jgi:4-hydroxy-3-polyprenylbenzoate decarboxylase
MDEIGVKEISPETILGCDDDRLVIYPHRDIGAVIASGSFKTDGMIICPCSSNTLGAMASGLGDNLITRAAAVTMKEGRRLVIVPREMPMGRIDLLNALRLNESGAIICPASPGFYMMPSSVNDLVEFVVGKLLDLLDVPHELNIRWADQLAAVGFSPDRSAGE